MLGEVFISVKKEGQGRFFFLNFCGHQDFIFQGGKEVGKGKRYTVGF